MIAPHELKNKTFTRAVRGYSPVEVDDYFDFLIEKYTEAYKVVNELEQKYNTVKAKYDELSNEEESIRSAILKAQKLGEVIVNNAKNEAAEILEEAEKKKTDKEAELQKECDIIIADARKKVLAEQENIAVLRKSAMDFQHKLYSDYVKHVEMLQNMKLDEMLPDVSEALDETLEKAKNEALSDEEFVLIAESEASPAEAKEDNIG